MNIKTIILIFVQILVCNKSKYSHNCKINHYKWKYNCAYPQVFVLFLCGIDKVNILFKQIRFNIHLNNWITIVKYVMCLSNQQANLNI